jgi:hypothetical protein
MLRDMTAKLRPVCLVAALGTLHSGMEGEDTVGAVSYIEDLKTFGYEVLPCLTRLGRERALAPRYLIRRGEEEQTR